MLATILIPLALAGGIDPDPIDPEVEIMIVDATFDEIAICPLISETTPLLAAAVGEYQLALDMLIAWAVEEYEEGYGQNLTEQGEDHLIELLEDCL